MRKVTINIIGADQSPGFLQSYLKAKGYLRKRAAGENVLTSSRDRGHRQQQQRSETINQGKLVQCVEKPSLVSLARVIIS